MQLDDILGRQHGIIRHIPLVEYLDAWNSHRPFQLNAAGRIVEAIGKGRNINTSQDPKLGAIHSNRTITIYDKFVHLHGIEETIHKIVQFLYFASLGLEQERQILYLLGPVSSGKSTIVDLLKELAGEVSMFVLGIMMDKKPVASPVYESPLVLFNNEQHGKRLSERFGIPSGRLQSPMSSWAAAKLEEFDGHFDNFVVLEVKASAAMRIGIARVEPGGDKEDVGPLVGRAALSGKLDEYDFSGGLNRTTIGLCELFELFKIPQERHLPLLSATTDRRYSGAGNVGELPYQGVLLAHSNMHEWRDFKGRAINEALVNRITPIEVPYPTGLDAEVAAYKEYLARSELRTVKITHRALEIPARFALNSRYTEANRSKKLMVYSGEPWEKPATGLRSSDDYRRDSKWEDGMSGVPPRDIFRAVIPVAAGKYPDALGLDPITLYEVLEEQVIRERWPEFNNRKPADILKLDVLPTLKEIVIDAIQQAYIADYEKFTEERFGLYFEWADAWIQDQTWKNPHTEESRDREWLNIEMMKLEKGTSAHPNPKLFRDNLIKAVLRHRARQRERAMRLADGVATELDEKPDSHATIVVELRHALAVNGMPTKDEMLPVIDFNLLRDSEKEKKEHQDFVERLCSKLTPRQARSYVDWYIKHVI